jgi:hypothetical protein
VFSLLSFQGVERLGRGAWARIHDFFPNSLSYPVFSQARGKESGGNSEQYIGWLYKTTRLGESFCFWAQEATQVVHWL